MPMTPEDQAIAEAELASMQGAYEAARGIPKTGRSRYDQWLADQWRTSAMRWALYQSGLMGETPDLEYSDWLDVSPQSGTSVANLGAHWASRLREMSAQEQREYLERLPAGLREYGQQEVFRGAIGGPRFMRQGVTAQAFGAPMLRAFETEPEGEKSGSTYLDWLRGSYTF